MSWESKSRVMSNISSVFTIKSNMTVDTGALPVMYYDVNGDKKVDVIDLNAIGQHFNEKTGKLYSVYDVNGEGMVNILDLNAVGQ